MITITLTDEQQVTLDIILGAIGGNPKTSAYLYFTLKHSTANYQ